MISSVNLDLTSFVFSLLNTKPEIRNCGFKTRIIQCRVSWACISLVKFCEKPVFKNQLIITGDVTMANAALFKG